MSDRNHLSIYKCFLLRLVRLIDLPVALLIDVDMSEDLWHCYYHYCCYSVELDSTTLQRRFVIAMVEPAE
jgi:hypothetical protein